MHQKLAIFARANASLEDLEYLEYLESLEYLDHLENLAQSQLSTL